MIPKSTRRACHQLAERSPPDRPWLVILDNADDLETMLGPQQCNTISLAKIDSGGLAVSLPRSSVGSMIITTRDRHVGE